MQFQDDNFGSLSGARVVRIATHPDYIGMGYGSRAMDLLMERLQQEATAPPSSVKATRLSSIMSTTGDLHTEILKPKDATTMRPLLQRLDEIHLPWLDWMGVAYGLTADLLKFWKRKDMLPVYVRQTNVMTFFFRLVLKWCVYS